MEDNKSSRLQNTLKNFHFGVIAQIAMSLLGFLSRTVFI